jgi:UDP-N-acetyl-D-mannosaminuronic acid dehydrogenase
MSISRLRKVIANQSAKLAVIGLGYVGLPVAALFSENGFDVLGVDVKPERVEKINSGVSPIEGNEPGLNELIATVLETRKLKATTDYQELGDRDIILIDVETPVDEHHIPQYDALRSVLTDLRRVMKPGVLIIVESTIAPGTMNSLVKPYLEKGGLKINQDFFLGNCPERVMPGKLLTNLETLSRVVGGATPETAHLMVSLYQNIVKADLDPVDMITAELVKTVENTYRDVQIAFANEVALISEALGADVWKVRELVNKSPYRNMHLPGAGVGGHCIPKDPWLLAYGVRDKEIDLKLIPAARWINDHMPLHLAKMLENAFKANHINTIGSKVLVLGYAYLENSDDTRNSPSQTLVLLLRNRGVEVKVHDPWVAQFQGDLYDLASG